MSDVLAKLWKDFSQQPHLYADKQIAEALKGAVQDIQAQIDTNFGGQLKSLIPELKTFGYTTSPAYVTFSINARSSASTISRVCLSRADSITLSFCRIKIQHT